MLWYKAWLETRLRFLLCLIGITLQCAHNVYSADTGLRSPVNDAYYHSVLHATLSQLAIFWILAVNPPTMGGLLREKAVGAASFTLALPFSRAHLACVRTLVALFEGLAMIVVPWLATYTAGALFGRTYLVSQALMHLAYLTGGGIVYFAIALLASALVEGEYVAPLLSAGVVIAIASALDAPSWRNYNPGNFMTGGSHYFVRMGLLTGTIPWGQIAVYAAISVVVAIASIRALQVREF